jgi:hypothetical protein
MRTLEVLQKAKAGDDRGVWDILDRLLPVAKDPEVVEMAKRLRGKIEVAVHPPTSD